MKKMEDLIKRVKKSKISDNKKKRLLSVVLAFTMLFSLSSCEKKDSTNISSNHSIEECLDIVDSLTYLDDYLYKNGFNELNEKYIKARKEENLNEIRNILPEMYNLFLKGMIVDSLIKNGTINVVEDTNAISIASYDNDASLYCTIEYKENNEKLLAGNIKVKDSNNKTLMLKITKEAEKNWHKINNNSGFDLKEADEIIEIIAKTTLKTGQIKKGNFYTYDDDVKSVHFYSDDQKETTKNASKTKNKNNK